MSCDYTNDGMTIAGAERLEKTIERCDSATAGFEALLLERALELGIEKQSDWMMGYPGRHHGVGIVSSTAGIRKTARHNTLRHHQQKIAYQPILSQSCPLFTRCRHALLSYTVDFVSNSAHRRHKSGVEIKAN